MYKETRVQTPNITLCMIVGVVVHIQFVSCFVLNRVRADVLPMAEDITTAT